MNEALTLLPASSEAAPLAPRSDRPSSLQFVETKPQTHVAGPAIIGRVGATDPIHPIDPHQCAVCSDHGRHEGSVWSAQSIAARQVAIRPSLLRMSVGVRLAVALVLSATIWAATLSVLA